MIVYVCTAVGADAHIGPCTACRIRRSLVQKMGLSLRADVGIGPYDSLCDKRSFTIALHLRSRGPKDVRLPPKVRNAFAAGRAR